MSKPSKVPSTPTVMRKYIQIDFTHGRLFNQFVRSIAGGAAKLISCRACHEKNLAPVEDARVEEISVEETWQERSWRT
jgi:hypothetical protein